MNFEEILLGTESRQVEYKESDNKGMYKTLSAFSNTDGGVVLVGVADDKTVVGFDCSNENIKQMTDTIVNKLQIHPVITPLIINDKEILKIEIFKCSCPVSYEGRYYSRVGNTTRKMLDEELKNYFLRSTQWDCIQRDFTLDEIDEKSVENFVKLAVKSGRMPQSAVNESVTDILNHLNLIQNRRLTNGAVILFGKNPQKYFTNAIV
ncbi:MAG: putative DNA binding domain-containing protein, partial [Methanogenium sp.]|nr:putative DNA binding domain-containing protein [Methanogenium sp.]